MCGTTVVADCKNKTWRELTVRALWLGKDALLRTVMVQFKSFELSAEVLAESGLLILLGAEQSWIKEGIGVEKHILLGKWKKVLSKGYSNDAEWMQKCKVPPFRGLPFHDFEQVVNTSVAIFGKCYGKAGALKSPPIF